MLGFKVCFSPVFQAQAVALTVAQAFTVAFELWQVAKEGRKCTLVLELTHTLSMEELFYQCLTLLVFVLKQP